MDKYARFIEAYKQLESELFDIEWDFKKLEEASDKRKMNKLRLCRNIRNYIQHVDDYKMFLEVTDGMIETLEEEYKRLRYQRDVVDKHMVKLAYGTCMLDDFCQDVIARMVKKGLDEVFVIWETNGKRVIRMIKLFDLVKATTCKKGVKVLDVKCKHQNFVVVAPDLLIKDVQGRIALCTDNGSIDGKLLGVFRNPLF